ncbi:hypothetical protein FO519_006823 [Halicephalobus sp. NKZ332]|nr:hypothetical protein FO519_006823 [Halicephalobus sp. NKZ332]
MIAAGTSQKKEKIESELQSNSVTRTIPGALENFVEDFVQREIEEAEIEAVFKIINAEEKVQEETSEEQSSLFDRISYNLWTIESILSNHMWIIALVWLLVSGLHWLVGIRFISAKGSLLTKPAGPPIPFFPDYSRGIVDDHYFGNNAAPEDLLRKSEIAILMYYAPWSLHAMEARKPFIEVATSFQFIPMVKFSAVNCNTKFGKCRRAFKLYSYPVIVGYFGKSQIQYNGPRTATGLFNFVRHLLKPVVKVNDIRELEKDFEEFKYLVIGYFPFTSENAFKEYTTFIATALKSGSNLEKFGSTRFIVIQNLELANSLGLDWTNRIRVYSKYKETGWQSFRTSFTVMKVTTSDDILDWIGTKVEKENNSLDIPWIHLENLEAGGKSEELFKYLNNSALGILFTTDYDGFAESKSTKILRKINQYYFDCGEEEIQKFDGNYMDLEKVIEGQNSCKKSSLNLEDVSPCCKFIKEAGICSGKNVSMNLGNEVYCNSLFKVFDFPLISKKCCSFRKKSENSEFNINWETKVECEWYKIQKKTSNLGTRASNLIVFKNDVNGDTDIDGIRGMGCKGNETLRFILMDKKKSNFFIENWNLKNESYFGTDERLRPDLMTIISTSREEHYLLEDLSTESLIGFVKNFHQSKLKKIKFSEKAKVEKEEKNNLIKFETLSTEKFEEFMSRRKNHDSIVFFTGGQVHGPSAVISYILHSVASYFREFDGLIKFYKIDTLRNELPYQYSFERVPALMFFPAREVDSSRYPNELPFTVPNILAFVLSRCQPELRWRIALSSCSSACIQKNRLKLKHFSSNIEEDLRKLRIMRFHESRKMKTTSGSRMNFLKIAIQRRILQKKAAIHLEKILFLLESGKKLDKEREDEVIRDSLFVRWLLYNHFGLNYSK